MDKNNGKSAIIFVYGNMNDDNAMRETVIISELSHKLDIRQHYDCLCDLANTFAKMRGFDFGVYVWGYDCTDSNRGEPLIETEFEGIDKQFMHEYITSERDFCNSLKDGKEAENENDTEKTLNGILTQDNVTVKLRHYIETLKQSVKEKPYPINKDILMTFSFYMDYAINRTNLVTVNKLHNIITSYFVNC